jgi:hypothetical protein
MMKNLILGGLLFVSAASHSQTPGNIAVSADAKAPTNTTTAQVTEGYKLKKTVVKTSYKVSTLRNNITIENTNGFTSTFNRLGSTATIVNSDGTHSTIVSNGNTSTVTTSTGALFTVITNDNVSLITSNLGKVSTVTNNGATSTIVNADASVSTLNNFGNISIVTYPNGTAYATFNYSEFIKGDPERAKSGISINGETLTATLNLEGKSAKPQVNTVSTTTTTTATVPLSDNTTDDNVTYEPITNLAEKAMAGYWARPAVEHVLVANESAAGMNKFEIDLFSGNSNFKKANHLVWLWVSASSSAGLSDGVYSFSHQNAGVRGPLKFFGTVKSGGLQADIVDGTVNVKTEGKRITIDYALKLNNGKRVTGRYSGKFKTEDRSSK